jgi:hypothetical protein
MIRKSSKCKKYSYILTMLSKSWIYKTNNITEPHQIFKKLYPQMERYPISTIYSVSGGHLDTRIYQLTPINYRRNTVRAY